MRYFERLASSSKTDVRALFDEIFDEDGENIVPDWNIVCHKNSTGQSGKSR